ncbi:MAG: hypothetical protein CML33_09415 [Rhodobacteraceae bacterium]|nr:hypothetical protein [Paracoccaceae bacterium]|tara:strand:- start:159 stop:407 length:249 start_codon:yes stop_codon:yes gene_type:complete
MKFDILEDCTISAGTWIDGGVVHSIWIGFSGWKRDSDDQSVSGYVEISYPNESNRYGTTHITLTGEEFFELLDNLKKEMEES